MNVLIVEDDSAIAAVLEYAFRRDGNEVTITARGREAVRLASSADIIILDIGLPDIDGFDVCRLVRQQSDVPILFLTSRAEEIERVVGLEIGGDDYVVKPFSPREVIARTKAIMRRKMITPKSATGGLLCYGQLELDADCFRVRHAGREVTLTAQEFRLLATLVRHPGRVFSRQQLLDLAWGDGGVVGDRTIDVHIKTLRQKIPGCNLIQTIRGVGYRVKTL